MVKENWDALHAAGIDPGCPRPSASAYCIDAYRGKLSVRVPPTPENVEACKRIPDFRAWDGAITRTWLCKPTRRNVEHLRKSFPNAEWTAEASALVDALVPEEQEQQLRETKHALLAEDVEVTDYKFGTQPFAHQKRAFLLSRDAKAFALLMEQGTGKTKVVIDTACYLFGQGRITGVLVVAPNSVKSNWTEDEIPTHTPSYVPYRAVTWSSQKKPQKHDLKRDHTTLVWLVMNVEALATAKGREFAEWFLSEHDALMVIDESTRIKTPSAQRTKAAWKLGRRAKYRRILSGLPITQGPLDAFAQFKFLDEAILGFGSFYAFRNHFAIMGGFGGKEIVAYANLDELQRLIDPYSFRVLKADCLDLPPKVYQKRTVELTAEQRRLYDQMKNEMIAELGDGHQVSTTIVLTQMLRLQQIVGGFLPKPTDNPDDDAAVTNGAEQEWKIPGANPKLDALLEVLDDAGDGKAIVWARFRAEIDLICAALAERYGAESVVPFHGGVSEEDRRQYRKAFQDPASPVRFFVGQTETGGIGLTLTAAQTVIYFSNSFSLESRLQSEDRAHRIGQAGTVTYIDLVAKDTLDGAVLQALRNKRNLADLVTGDAWRKWI